jgi:hypothetical protein
MRTTALCATFLLAGTALMPAAGALEAAQPPLPRPVPIVEGTIDLSAAPGSPENLASIAFLEKLPSAPELIYLDLTIAPAVTDPAANPATDPVNLDFGATAYDAASGKALSPFPCELGAWQMLDRSLNMLTLAPSALDTHLLMTIEVARGEHAPFNSVSCDYAPGLPAQVALHVTGFFVVQETAIPTARGLRLVPYTPPYAEAVDALARSIAAP